MARRMRRAVSTYVEVFVLMAVVLAGSALAYEAITGLASSSEGGAAVEVSAAAIRQGAGVAVETMTIANTGTVGITSFSMTTAGVSSAAPFYLHLLNPSTGSTVPSGCGIGTNPLSILVCYSLLPGQSVVATLTIEASPFTVGARYTILVSASPAAEVTVPVVAVSA